MLARLERELPAGDYLYEPKWDGFRALAFRDGPWAELQSRQLNRFGRYFPELIDALRALRAESFAIDGEIVVFGPEVADFGALLMRIHPAASRASQLSLETPATFIAFDVLAIGDEDLRGVPFVERRGRLEGLLHGAAPPLMITPISADAGLAARWLDRFTGSGVDGVIAKPRSLLYQPGKRAMVKVKKERSVDCVVAGLRVSDDEVTSLLLGLFAKDGGLRHVGVASSFGRVQRRELFAHLSALVAPLAGHPWERGFGIDRRPAGRLPGGAGSWTPDMSMDWVPVRPVLVCEVTYTQLDGDRFRHPTRFKRWRPDRAPESCTFEQLESSRPAA
jgi:ATP-dependent DNA ligase